MKDRIRTRPRGAAPSFLETGLLLGLILSLLAVGVALAAGNISATDKWAWSTNAGWINFNPANGGVTVYNDHLEGYAWAENAGWINPWGQNPVTINAEQPYPLIGWMEVQWRLPISAITSSVSTGAGRAVQLHLDEYRQATSPGRRSAAVYQIAASSISAAAPSTTDSVSGTWRYQLQGAAGQPNEAGMLWLRSNGAMVQGVMEGPAKRQDALAGEISGEGKALLLLRSQPRGPDQRIRLTQRGRGYVGAVEGTRQTVELARP